MRPVCPKCPWRCFADRVGGRASNADALRNTSDRTCRRRCRHRHRAGGRCVRATTSARNRVGDVRGPCSNSGHNAANYRSNRCVIRAPSARGAVTADRVGGRATNTDALWNTSDRTCRWRCRHRHRAGGRCVRATTCTRNRVGDVRGPCSYSRHNTAHHRGHRSVLRTPGARCAIAADRVGSRTTYADALWCASDRARTSEVP